MGLQEEVNAQVGSIQAKLTSAANATGEITPVDVDLSEAIEEIDDAQGIDNSPLVAALVAICDSIDSSGGDTLAARGAIASIANSSVPFGKVKDALTAVTEVAAAISTNVDRATQAAKDHIAGGTAMFDLLVAQSNFDGADQ